jgi:hypothetical protein
VGAQVLHQLVAGRGGQVAERLAHRHDVAGHLVRPIPGPLARDGLTIVDCHAATPRSVSRSFIVVENSRRIDHDADLLAGLPERPVNHRLVPLEVPARQVEVTVAVPGVRPGAAAGSAPPAQDQVDIHDAAVPLRQRNLLSPWSGRRNLESCRAMSTTPRHPAAVDLIRTAM